MTKRASSQLTIEVISPYFTQSIQTASRNLGVCCTLLKKICRKYGITRWPYRKIQSIERSIQQTKERLQFLEQIVAQEQNGNAYNEMLKLRTELFELERKRESLLRPDKALINPYNLEPNYRLSLDANGVESLERHSWLYLPTQELVQQKGTSLVKQQTDNSGSIRPLSPIVSLDSSEPECSAHSSSCNSRRVPPFPKCEDFEDYDTARYPLEVTSEVTAYSEAGSPMRKNHFIMKDGSFEYHQDSSYELPSWNMQWAKDFAASRIQKDMSLQQTNNYEKLSYYGVPQGFSHSPMNDEDHRLANRFQQLPWNERDTTWNDGMGAFGTLNKALDRENSVTYKKGLTGFEGQMMYNTFQDDIIASNVTSTDDMSTIDEDISYNGEYEKNKPMKNEIGSSDSCWDHFYLQKTLFSVCQRMEQLEQENQRLRSKLSRLLGSFSVQAEETRGERCNFYKGVP
ncbi:hypothetical protein GpartN1_g5653.t1 [Galdieria partita]|uniref:RWP-RK domain-containing protein n=1 Tax=Galdieria partita TaxID=83374 RepID=A0A9C7Q1L0_9RHOD|nr:hypothetical protein GpartN1_g5653.t1 [Galdieria partita]